MVTAEDARGWTALHYACRTIAQAKRSDSTTDQSLVKEKAEEVRDGWYGTEIAARASRSGYNPFLYYLEALINSMCVIYRCRGEAVALLR